MTKWGWLSIAATLCITGSSLIGDARMMPRGVGSAGFSSIIPVITLKPTVQPAIMDTTTPGAVVSVVEVLMSDGTAYTGGLSFGAPNFDSSGKYKILGSTPFFLTVDAAGLGSGARTDHVTVVAGTTSQNINIPVTNAPTVVAANGNCAGAHAGTAADPFPASCIVTAVNSLPAAGGTVTVGDGVWDTLGTTVSIFRGNFNLVGNSLNARLTVTGAHGFYIQSGGNDDASSLPNVRITNLTIDPTLHNELYEDAFNLFNLRNSQVDNCDILNDPNGSLSTFILFGGSYNSVLKGHWKPNTTGFSAGPMLQLNPLGVTSNFGFLIKDTDNDGGGMLIIGINSVLVTQNKFHNTSGGGSVGLLISPSLGSTNVVNSDGVVIDNNIMDATIGGTNNVTLSGIPQDPGEIGAVRNMKFINNTMSGGVAIIGLNDFEQSCLDTCNPLPRTFDSVIVNNHMHSYFGGSVINIRGGANITGGVVNGVLVQGNTLITDPAASTNNQIIQDSNTLNATIVGNTCTKGTDTVCHP